MFALVRCTDAVGLSRGVWNICPRLCPRDRQLCTLFNTLRVAANCFEQLLCTVSFCTPTLLHCCSLYSRHGQHRTPHLCHMNTYNACRHFVGSSPIDRSSFCIGRCTECARPIRHQLIRCSFGLAYSDRVAVLVIALKRRVVSCSAR